VRYPTPALWRVKVLEVHDGDTVHLLVDRGDEDDSRWWTRLKDVFAPELAQTGGPECRGFVTAWVAQHGDGTDWPFLLETFRTPRSDVDLLTLSRHVGRITAADGACLNDDVAAFIKANGYPGGIGG
jgi:hypothetical protein